jgi:OFA family oxalate/formate antiporter-like MFS transporter
MKKYYRYLVGVAGFIVTLCGGTLYAWGVFVPTLQEFFQVSRAEIMVPFAVASITFALGMVPAGRLQDKKGPKIVTILGGILAGLGYSLSSTATHVGHLVIYFGLIGGAGIALSYNGAVAGGVKWFPDLKGTATGILVGGFGLGALAFGPVAHTLIGRVGWQDTFLILGSLFAIIIVIVALLIIKNPPAGWKPEGWNPAKLTRGRTVEYTGRDFEVVAAIKTPEFIGMWLHFFLIISGGFAIITHVKPFSIDFLQFTPAAATGLIMLLSLLNFSGRLVLGPLSDRIGRINTFTIIGTLMAIAVSIFALIYYFQISALLYIIVVLGGLAFGGYLALSPAFVADVFGLKNIGVNYGAMFTAWGVAGIYGPYLAGMIYDVFGSYDIAFIVFAIQCVIGVLLARFYVKPRLRFRIQQITRAQV